MEIKAPNKFDVSDKNSIFLAGTIDNGNSEDWQTRFTQWFTAIDFTVFNPRREDWNSELKPKIDVPEFKEQVDWEHDALNSSDYIVFNFLKDSVNPITMMELAEWGTTCKSVCDLSGRFLAKRKHQTFLLPLENSSI